MIDCSRGRLSICCSMLASCSWSDMVTLGMTYCSGTLGCTTRIVAFDSNVVGSAQLIPHTMIQHKNAGSRSHQRRLDSILTYCSIFTFDWPWTSSIILPTSRGAAENVYPAKHRRYRGFRKFDR